MIFPKGDIYQKAMGLELFYRLTTNDISWMSHSILLKAFWKQLMRKENRLPRRWTIPSGFFFHLLALSTQRHVKKTLEALARLAQWIDHQPNQLVYFLFWQWNESLLHVPQVNWRYAARLRDEPWSSILWQAVPKILPTPEFLSLGIHTLM